MELRQIQYFIQLYKDNNITKASRNLFISQQGLSKSISRLEEEVGFPLFKRSASGVAPTDAARHLYDYFNKISNSYHELELAVHNIRQTRVLNITACHGFALTCRKDTFSEYGRRHPSVKILYKEDFNKFIPDCLLDKKADIAFMQAPIPPTLCSHQIVSREPVCIVMDSAHPFAGKKELNLYDLSGQEILFLDLMDAYNQNILEFANRQGISFCIDGTAGMNEYLHLILGSRRIGFSSRQIYQYYDFPEITFVPLSAEAHPDLIMETHLVTSGDFSPDEETQNYIDYMKEKEPLL